MDEDLQHGQQIDEINQISETRENFDIKCKTETLLASKNGGHWISSKSRSAQYGTSNRSISLNINVREISEREKRIHITDFKIFKLTITYR